MAQAKKKATGKKAIPAKVAAKKAAQSARVPTPRGAPLADIAPEVDPEDHPEGKGLAEAVRRHNVRNEADDLPENTAEDQARRKKEAEARARAKVAELPNSPADELILKSTKLPADVRVMRYHDGTQWASCLMWVHRVEKEVEDLVPGKKKGKPRVECVVDSIQCIRQGDNGQLVHSKFPPRDAMHFAEIIGGYPIGPAITHFRKHADTIGASKPVRDLLGLKGEPPVQFVEVVVRDDAGKVVGVEKVEKPRKGGNSNKPQPNAELDELYGRAARLLQTPEKQLREKYAHLNNGLQAMNLRNRLRAKGHNV